MVDTEKWNAILNRDAEFDDVFYYGVKTTMVYCKPSCSARKPLPKNVVYFADHESAEKAGFRACKCCQPYKTRLNNQGLFKLLYACQLIDNHRQGALTAALLADSIKLTQYQLHRLFKKYLGVTPKSYIDQVQLRQLKKNLRISNSVTDAIYDSGIESSSVIYGRMKSHLGMTPKKYRESGNGVEISYAVGQTEMGRVLIAATDKGLCFLQFGETDHLLLAQLASEYSHAIINPMPSDGEIQLLAWLSLLNEYVMGLNIDINIPLDVKGTAFQKKVWDFLRQIPYGDVMSYSEIAKAIGSPKAYRAVANACASNKVAIVIPCHRVIRGDGGLGGYRWGESRKRTIIDMERRNCSK